MQTHTPPALHTQRLSDIITGANQECANRESRTPPTQNVQDVLIEQVPLRDGRIATVYCGRDHGDTVVTIRTTNGPHTILPDGSIH